VGRSSAARRVRGYRPLAAQPQFANVVSPLLRGSSVALADLTDALYQIDFRNLMRRILSLITVIVALFAFQASSQAEWVFQDDFSASNGTLLNGSTPDVGSNWNVTSGAAQLTISNSAVDTSFVSGSMTFAFGAFTRALTSGETLTFSFNTGTSANNNFLTTGWAGLSLYTGGSGGTEQFFLGSVGLQPYWGIDGAAAGGKQVFSNITSAAQSVTFTYAYDSGAWVYTVGANTMSGVTSSNLAFNTLRIGADFSDLSSIKVEDVAVQFSATSAVPEPSTYAAGGLLAAIGAFQWMRRRQRAATR
jgi:hypothetical protein